MWSSQLKDNIVVSGSTDRTLRVWNAETGECIHVLQGHASTVRCLAMHENKVVSGSRDGTLRVWDVKQGLCLSVLIGHAAAVRWWVRSKNAVSLYLVFIYLIPVSIIQR